MAVYEEADANGNVNQYAVRMIVEHNTDKKTCNLLDFGVVGAIRATKAKKITGVYRRVGENAAPKAYTSTISISDLIRDVKPGTSADEDFGNTFSVGAYKKQTQWSWVRLLDAATFIGQNTDDGRHPEAEGGWDKYRIVFEVAGKYFDGEISIMLIDGNRRRFHDITKIRDITTAMQGRNAPRHGNISDNSISGEAGNSNNMDNKRGVLILKRRGLQLPNRLNRGGLIHSILDADSPVNRKYLEQTGSIQFKRWFGNSKVVNEDGSQMKRWTIKATQSSMQCV